MLRNFILAAGAALIAVATTGELRASVIDSTSGSYVGTFDGNDPFTGDGKGYLFESPSLYKCDDIGEGLDPSCVDRNGIVGGAPWFEDYSDGDFTITFDVFKGDDGEEEAIGGTWSFAPTDGETLLPHYIVLKAGPKYAVWDVLGLTSGDWSTDDEDGGLGKKGISHISFYNTGEKPPPGPVVPLPAGGVLLLTGLGALALRKRR